MDLIKSVKNGKTVHQHSGQQPVTSDAMDDVANTVEYIWIQKRLGHKYLESIRITMGTNKWV